MTLCCNIHLPHHLLIPFMISKKLKNSLFIQENKTIYIYIDGEGLYGEPSHGAARSGAATDVAAGGAAGVAAGAVGVAVSGAAAGAVGVAARGAAGVAAVGGACGANGAVAGDDTVPVASVELDASDCDELTSANPCCSIIQINITQLPLSYDSPTSSTTPENIGCQNHQNSYKE